MAYSVIKKPSDYFNTKLWTGDGNTTQAITGVNFQPDLVWEKGRNLVSSNLFFDAIRGANVALVANSANAEVSVSGYINSFDSDGFTVGNDGAVNGSGNTYVAWNWLGANGTASNTDGSITSTVSANTTSGFSIVSYTGNGTAGATIGHGLGAVPKWFIVKRRNASGGWVVYNEALGNTKIIELHDTSASQTSSAAWNNTSPSSTTFTLGDYTATNTSGGTYIAYCFAEKKGFSKFGSYTGNGNADGAFIYTGFKPAFVIIKKTNAAGSWWMDDNKRDTFNPTLKALQANSNEAESADGAGDLDFLSNGFKCRDNTDAINVSGGSYIYMAFADEPLVGDNPATAR